MIHATPGSGDVLVVPRAQYDQLIQHALEGDPDEVCGILAGTGSQVEHVFQVRNAAHEVDAGRAVFRDRASGESVGGRPSVHYYMDPREQLRIYNQIDALQLEAVGYYHSHTHTEAQPSPTDIRLAADLSATYVLVSLQDRSQPVVRAWRIVKVDPDAETGELRELPIQVRSC